MLMVFTKVHNVMKKYTHNRTVRQSKAYAINRFYRSKRKEQSLMIRGTKGKLADKVTFHLG